MSERGYHMRCMHICTETIRGRGAAQCRHFETLRMLYWSPYSISTRLDTSNSFPEISEISNSLVSSLQKYPRFVNFLAQIRRLNTLECPDHNGTFVTCIPSSSAASSPADLPFGPPQSNNAVPIRPHMPQAPCTGNACTGSSMWK